MMDKKIFKAYDIRAIYPDEIDEDSAYLIGRAFVTDLKCREVIVGQDKRISSPSLFKALTRGIMDQGADVIDIGLCSTPYFYFGTAKHEAGIMVTASHNPPQYNGFKMCRNGTVPIGLDSGLDKIRDIALEGKFPETEKKGKTRELKIDEEFIRHCLEFLDRDMDDKRLKIVIDTGNGMGGLNFPKVFDDVNVEVIPLFFDIDMTFPNHEANPVKEENLKDLKRAVIENGADFGAAIDGDCDRCVLIDEKGETVSSDFTLALLAKDILDKNPGSTILCDLRCSWATIETIKDLGGKPELTPVGHALIKNHMRKVDAIFGGELSGHFFFKDSYFSENSIIVVIEVINMLRREGKTLSDLAEPLRKYFQTGEINMEVKDRNATIAKIEKAFSEKAQKISHMDGIKMDFEDWWFNIRPSNTEPLLRLTLEAKTEDKMIEMRDKIVKMIN